VEAQVDLRKINDLDKMHCFREAGVAGSNPATPTIIFAAIARFLARFHRARNPNRIGPAWRLMDASAFVFCLPDCST